MNIEIANRLVELRKKNGLSQEELANKLGLSRQAVSKWERAEASPDTDNLICLAKLYNVSLDELLNTDEDIDEIVDNNKANDSDNSSNDDNADSVDKQVNIDQNGIYVRKGNKEVNIGFKGIHVRDGEGKEIHLGSKGYDFPNTEFSVSYKKYMKRQIWCDALNGAIWSLAIVLYVAMGALYNTWHPDWLIFLDAIVITSIFDAIKHKSFLRFNIAILATAVYLYLGFYLKLWHPGWVVFLAIPLYYIITPKSSWEIHVDNKDGITYKDFIRKRSYRETVDSEED